MKTRFFTIILLLSSLFSTSSMAADTLVAQIDRTWGVLLADDVTVTLDISAVENGIDESSLPSLATRYGTWLYLKSIDVSATQLDFHYQVVNVPVKNTSIDTPTFDIKDADGNWLAIPAAALTIGPSLAISEGASNIAMKADIAATPVSTTKIENDLTLFIGIAAVSGLILVLWHFGWKTKNRQPFAQAVHDLSRLSWQSVTPDQAARILHTAFNHTADTTVVYGELDELLVNHDWLAPLTDEIQQFFQQSEQHFFARKSEQGPDIADVRKLAKACRAKEMLA